MDESVFQDRDKFDEAVANYANAIKGNRDEFLRMLENMGHVLTHHDFQRRADGVRFLTTVISLLPQRFMNTYETAFAVQFFLRKLDDDNVVVMQAALRGLHELMINEHEMGDGEIKEIAEVMLFQVPILGLHQAERYIAYRMLAYMLRNYHSALHNIDSEFVKSCIQVIDCETDPRCLLQVFAIINMMCRNFILGELEESLFEVCANYFPIDFNPPARDEVGISREDLVEALLSCMIASAGFGKHSIQLALEKLDSDLAVAKLDSLKLLIRGADVYPVICFKEMAVLIWRQIRNLVFVNRHEDIIPRALDCLSSLSRVLSNQENTLRPFFKIIWKDLQQGAIPGMGRVLEAFIKPSAEACSVALVEALPSILQLLSENEGHRRVLVLESTSNVLSHYAVLCNHQAATQELSQLLGLLADLLCTLLTGGDDELASRAGVALCNALRIPDFLTESQLNIIKDLIIHVATHENAPALRNDHVMLLAAAACTARLPDIVWCIIREEIDRGLNSGQLERILEMITACAASPQSLSMLLPYLEDRFLSSIRGIVIYNRNHLAKCLKGIIDVAELYGVSFDHKSLLDNTVVAWMETVKSGHTNENSESFTHVAELLEKLSKKCSSSDMQKIIAYCEEACIDTSLADTSLLFLRCVVCHARPEALCATNWHFMQQLIDAHCQRGGENVPQCLAGYVNKLPDTTLEETLGCLSLRLEPGWTVAKAELLLWVTKALLLRGYPDLILCTTLLKELLKDENLGRPVAQGFKQILQPSVLTTEGHCTITLFHPQRFFVETVGFLIDGFYSATSEAVKNNFLMGLCYQLAYVPNAVVNACIDQILPILVTALSSEEGSIIHECVLPCLTENVGLMASCLGSVLPQLLQLAKSSFSMEVRRSALECLLRLSSIEEDKLLPHQEKVVTSLTQCLADRKRIVREVAAQASSMWHMVGESRGVQNPMLL
nr:MMS19 nucleotide excision repair protein homolog isoform X1 [Rhipicephalus microplus]